MWRERRRLNDADAGRLCCIRERGVGRSLIWVAGRMVGVPGLEPGTSCSRSKRASQLRYTPKVKPGEGHRDPLLRQA